MSRKTKFEIATEEETLAAVRAEQTPSWKPSYPGEQPPLNLSPDEIAAREAERDAQAQALIAGYAPPRQPWRKTVEGIEPGAAIEDVVPVEPILVPEQGALAAAKAKVIALQEEHRLASETRELKQKTELAAALAELGKLEQQTAVAVDAESGKRLREAIASMQESKAGDAVLAARVDAGTERQIALRKRASNAVSIAAQTRRLLREWDKEYGDELEKVASMSRDQFLLGVPNVGRQTELALALYAGIRTALVAIQQQREALTGMLNAETVRIHDGEIVAGFEKEIEILVEQVKTRWSKDDERQFVWCETRLAKASPDSVSVLQALARGVTGRMMQLRAMQAEVNVEPIQFERAATKPPQQTFEGVNTGAGWSGLEGSR